MLLKAEKNGENIQENEILYDIHKADLTLSKHHGCDRIL
jgi:hypothetical protein